jgi:hypothetical protein
VTLLVVALLCLSSLILVAPSTASAAGSGYAGGAGGASVGLATLKIYLVAPIPWTGKTFVLKKTPIPMTCRILPHTYKPPYKFVVAKVAKQLPPVHNTRRLTGFFAGVFKGVKDVITKFPHVITCVIRSNRITIHDRVFRSVGRKWERYLRVKVRPHVAIVYIDTSDFFELVEPHPTAPPQNQLCVVLFGENKYNIAPDSKAASTVKKCAETIVKRHYTTITITGYTNYIGTGDYNFKLSLERADATKVALEAVLAQLHAPSVTFVTLAAGVSRHFNSLAANRRASVTGPQTVVKRPTLTTTTSSTTTTSIPKKKKHHHHHHHHKKGTTTTTSATSTTVPSTTTTVK